MKKKVTFKGREYIIEVLRNGKIKIDGEEHEAIISQKLKNVYKVSVNGQTLTVEVKGKDIIVEGEESSLSVKPHFPQLAKESIEQKDQKVIIRAPIPGKIIQILVEEGEEVNKDQELLILEAMKMRNRIFSPIDGKITKIFVNKEENVSQDQVLLELEK